MVVGRWMAEATRIHRALAVWMGAVIVLSGPGADFIQEQLIPIQDAGGAIVKYLKTHARPGDVIVSNIGDMPLKYYLPNRVVGGLTGENLEEFTSPEWVISRRRSPTIPRR